MHESSMDLMRYFRNKYLPGKNKTVLDIGSMQIRRQQTYRSVFEDYKYTGMDISSGRNVDIVGFHNIVCKYDAVISGQVMEHVERPWEWIRQIALYSRRFICVIAPNTWREHRYPIDTFRYFPDGMRSLFKYANIKEIEIFSKGVDTIGIGSV